MFWSEKSIQIAENAVRGRCGMGLCDMVRVQGVGPQPYPNPGGNLGSHLGHDRHPKSSQQALSSKKITHNAWLVQFIFNRTVFFRFFMHVCTQISCKILNKRRKFFRYFCCTFLIVEPHDVSHFTMFYACLMFSILVQKSEKYVNNHQNPLGSKYAPIIAPAGAPK